MSTVQCGLAGVSGERYSQDHSSVQWSQYLSMFQFFIYQLSRRDFSVRATDLLSGNARALNLACQPLRIIKATKAAQNPV
jgi:hypothetical protein